MKKTIRLVMVAIMVFALFTACTTATAPSPTPVAKDILDETTDAMGNTLTDAVVLTESLTLVSTAPSITEILFALGVGDKVVGVDASSNYPAKALDIEKIGDFSGFDVEKVIALNPSIVFAGNGLQHEQILALTDVGVNVVSVEPTYFEDITQSIRIIGEQVGKQNEADTLINAIEEATVAISAISANAANKPTVYYAMSIGDSGYWTSGKGSFINDIITTAGGVSITNNSASEWLEYPTEDLIIADPDMLVVSSWVSKEALLADPVLKNLTAVKQGNYLIISDDLINRPGPRIVEAMAILQDFFLGE